MADTHIDFAFDQTGPGTSLPVVLLHGFPLTRDVWKPAADRAGCRIVAVDLPGFGQTPALKDYSMDSLAESLHDFLKSKRMLPCVLGGLSMGGYVALAFVKKYAGEVWGLVLADTKATADDAAGRQGRDDMIKLVRKQGSAAVAAAMGPKMLSPKASPELAASIRTMMESVSPAAIEAALRAMRDRPDRTADLPAMSIPTWVVVGADDVLAPPAAAEAMAKALPDAKLTIIPDAGHLAPVEQPELFAAELTKFVVELS